MLDADGSEGAQAAAVWCAGFARDLGAEVIAVCAYRSMIGRHHDHDAVRIREQVADELHGRWTAPLREAGVIVVGTHGLAPVLRLRMGGVAMRLLHETPVPLILVPSQ